MRNILMTVALLGTLVACGGGGGGGGGSVTPPVGPTPTSSSQPGATTNATLEVVNDSNGSPLAGERVVLMPFTTCGPTPAPGSITPENDGCATPLPSPQATTNAQGVATLNGAPNGKYILVIGNDTVSTPPPGYTPPNCGAAGTCPATPAPFTVQTTVHDLVTLSGGNQTLQAPNIAALLEAQGGSVPSTIPSWETNGDYRISTLDATKEMPCYIGWEYLRAQHGLAGSTPDEWLTEAERYPLEYTASTNNPALIAFITSANSVGYGGLSCYQDVLAGNGAFSTSAAVDPRAVWFGGGWELYEKTGTTFYQGFGTAEYPIDPRSSSGTTTWP